MGLTVDHRGPVVVITITRPERRNALDAGTIELLHAAYRDLGDRGTRVGIITGAAGHFCSGMDLKAFAAGEMGPEQERLFGEIVEHPPDIPMIAAVEGAALGGGWELALACDMIVAAEDAHFALPEARRGIVAMGGGPLRLPRRIPHGVAMELLLTGGSLTAQRAAQLGAVNRLAAPGDALAGALALAAEVAQSAPLATSALTGVVRSIAEGDLDWDGLRAVGRLAYASADAREGAIAFAERRAPAWTGR